VTPKVIYDLLQKQGTKVSYKQHHQAKNYSIGLNCFFETLLPQLLKGTQVYHAQKQENVVTYNFLIKHEIFIRVPFMI